MAGDRLGAFGRAARKQLRDFRRHARLEFHVLVGATLTVPSRRRMLASSSARHSCSACSSAASSTRMPCLSYRLRLRLHRTTTAESTLAFFALRVSAASPAARKTR
jgi:hypothetical protein